MAVDSKGRLTKFGEGCLKDLMEDMDLPDDRRDISKKENIRWLLKNMERLNPRDSFEDVHHLDSAIALLEAALKRK